MGRLPLPQCLASLLHQLRRLAKEPICLPVCNAFTLTPFRYYGYIYIYIICSIRICCVDDGVRPANEEYAQHLRGLVDRILHSLSVELGLVGGMLKAAVGGDELEYLLKINYYPPCPRPDLVLGVVAHTDLSALTILLPNDVPGLQVFMDDHWFDVTYVPGALVVHIGDQVEVRIIYLCYLSFCVHRLFVSSKVGN